MICIKVFSNQKKDFYNIAKILLSIHLVIYESELHTA